MSVLKILPGIYSVGVIDWNMRNFHGHTYSTKRGTTYNAYLIADEKNVLIDTVHGPFAGELIDNISEVMPVGKIDYVIANHVETDHSGALPAIMKLCPKAKVLGTAKCKEGLYRNYYGDWEFQTVKTGDTLELGKRTLSFIEAPMIHWPDSMFTYCPQEQLLMPNDAFGQHYATSGRFDDEVDECALMDEAAKYYSNILWPLSAVILRKLEEIQKTGLPIKMIAPSHGIIWRRDPMKIIKAYASWANNETRPKVVIAYETMWGSTEKMARKMAEGMIDAGVEVKLFDVNAADRTEVTKEMLEARGFLFGSSTHDNGMLPTMAAFLQFVKPFALKGRKACVFGSHGWAGGAVKEIEDILKSTGMEISQPGLSVKYVPDAEDTRRSYEYGSDFAKKIKGEG
ncbi:MAG: flavodoxin domain-containing protein [Candidatus Omnitrophota bacterium]|jgi:flavorubredoxin